VWVLLKALYIYIYINKSKGMEKDKTQDVAAGKSKAPLAVSPAEESKLKELTKLGTNGSSGNRCNLLINHSKDKLRRNIWQTFKMWVNSTM
jgi:hypothetical protein